jgi:hypothetical protein
MRAGASMLRHFFLSAAIILGGCQAEPEVPTEWTLEREYETPCLSPMGGSFVHEGVTFTSRGWSEDNHFMALNLVTGACTRAGDLSSGSRFAPRAASDQYLFANAGQYFLRYSTFDRTTWQRIGIVGLSERIWTAVLHDDRLYAIQDESGAPQLSVFTIPDLHFVEQHAINAPGMRTAVPLDDGFLISWRRDNRVHVAVIDFNGRIARQTSLRADPANRCDASARRLGDDAALVQTACSAYTVLDLATLAPRYPLTLERGEGVDLTDAFVVDGMLYVMEAHYFDRNRRPRVLTTLYDFATGERIGALPPLTAGEHAYHQQIGHRLIWASRAYMEDARVQVFDLRRRPTPAGN